MKALLHLRPDHARKRIELPCNAGADGDRVAQIEADHFEKCCVCSHWFGMRDLAQVAELIHDGREIEVLCKDRDLRRAKGRCTEGARGSLMGLRGKGPLA
jgi:hypothetical protein